MTGSRYLRHVHYVAGSGSRSTAGKSEGAGAATNRDAIFLCETETDADDDQVEGNAHQWHLCIERRILAIATYSIGD